MLALAFCGGGGEGGGTPQAAQFADAPATIGEGPALQR